MTRQDINYYEDLGIEGQVCPPQDAVFGDGETTYFRVVKTNPVVETCFHSHRRKFPEKPYPDECDARSLSVAKSLEGLSGYFRSPAFKKKIALIGVVTLSPMDGRVKQTGASYHYSWWRSAAFDLSTVRVQEIDPSVYWTKNDQKI